MKFGHCFPRILRKIVEADPRLGPVFLSKTDISDAYMRVRVRTAEIPKLTFVVPPNPSDT